jgi:hypothetical protein
MVFRAERRFRIINGTFEIRIILVILENKIFYFSGLPVNAFRAFFNVIFSGAPDSPQLGMIIKPAVFVFPFKSIGNINLLICSEKSS